MRKEKTVGLETDNPQDRIVRKRVLSLLPSPENLILYKPIDPDDSEIVKLANSIKRNGCDMLVVTLDNYIVSGHRRHVALVRNGQSMVSCRVLPVRRDAMSRDEYIAMLRDFNHQRQKSVAEQVREEMVDIDRTESYRKLQKLRDKSIHAPEYHGVESLEIEGVKIRHGISAQKADHVRYVKKVVFEDRRSYWPLSVRAVHYPLLNYEFLRNIPRKLPYRNDDGSYDATSDLITRMRLNGSIPWNAFDDCTRPLRDFHPFDNVREYVRQEVRNLFKGYWRDLLQTQPNHVELVIEKNTIYSMALSVTEKYQIWTTSGRGFCSIDPWHDLYERYIASGKERLIVIVLSDFDPEGEMIPHVCGRTLRDDFGVDDLLVVKAGVTRKQIEKYNLPPQNFAKEKSKNLKWFLEKTGGDDTVYELEALDPEDMLGDLESVIQSVLDMDLFNREAGNEQDESVYLEASQKAARDALRDLM